MLTVNLRHVGAVLSLCGFALGSGAMAQDADDTANDVLDLLRLTDTLEIMRIEGMTYSQTLAGQMLPGGGGASWKRALARVYEADRMEDTVRDGFAESLDAQGIAIDSIEAFLASDLGRQVVSLEVSARDAMQDPAIEEAARAAYLALQEEGAEASSRLALIDTMIAEHDLIEANVVGGMNSSVRFYQGLAEGDAIGMSESDILQEVWATEAETRTDTTEWLYGFLLMAYGPLSDAEMAEYVSIFATPAGKAVNRALFAGFDAMFSDLSYGVGQALAFEMQAQDL